MESLNSISEFPFVSDEAVKEMKYLLAPINDLKPHAVKTLAFVRNCSYDDLFDTCDTCNKDAYDKFYGNRFCINYIEVYMCYYS
uniref:Uncharacterized protein n=1 Tax=viral metagenome TaxID=1070528 RepID=A0A6C0J657_9ZZZZ